MIIMVTIMLIIFMVHCNGPRQPALQIDLGIMRNHGHMADFLGDASPTPGAQRVARRPLAPSVRRSCRGSGSSRAPANWRPQPPRRFRPHGAGGCQNRRCIAGRSGIRLGSHDYCCVEIVPSALHEDCPLGLCRLRRLLPLSGCAAIGGEVCAGTFLSAQSALFAPNASDCSRAEPQRSEFATIAVERRVWPTLISGTSRQRGRILFAVGAAAAAL